MQTTSRQIEEFYKENGSIVGMLSRGVRKALAFMDETIVSYDITKAKWSFAEPETNQK